MNTIKIGTKGEKAACLFLEKSGYRIIKRNYRKRYGEIDIIAQKGDILAFVEVKTRKSIEYGLACEAVTKEKKQKILKTAQTYICENNINLNYSFDIIEVYHSAGKIQKIEHLENAIYFWR